MPIEIYHITHINNLHSILQSGGLIAKSKQKQQQINYTDIAHQSIQGKRATKQVPCGAGGGLHDYIPFYFAPRSPMLFSIHKGNVESYPGGQDPVIHLVSEAEVVKASEIPFVFTDGHAIMAYSDFFDDLELLEEKIDWELMESKYWSETRDDPDRKRRRQAEFLIYKFCPWKLIRKIGVINSYVRIEVQEIIQEVDHQPPIKVYFNWYY